jgi:hypothetical protein
VSPGDFCSNKWIDMGPLASGEAASGKSKAPRAAAQALSSQVGARVRARVACSHTNKKSVSQEPEAAAPKAAEATAEAVGAWRYMSSGTCCDRHVLTDGIT